MPLSRFLNEFGLDPELVFRDREVSAGLANAHQHAAMELEPNQDRWFMHMIASATEYRRAGAHSVLLSDQKGSREMFREAGRAYAKIRRPYALMMFWCSEEIDSVLARGRDFGSLEGIDRRQLPYLLLSTAAGAPEEDPERLESIQMRLAGSQVSSTGILGVPVGAFLDLAHALGRNQAPGASIAEALIPFLSAYSTAIRRCMEDEYHWQRMAFPFHPAEPDVLGVIFCVEAALRRRQQGSVLDLLKFIPLFPAATNILYNAIEERFSIQRPSKLNEERIMESILRAADIVRLAGISGDTATTHVAELVRRELMAQGLTVEEQEVMQLVKGLISVDRPDPETDANNRRWLRHFLEEELRKKGLDPDDFLEDILN